MTNQDAHHKHGFVPPEHPNAKPHKRLMKRLANMSVDEFIQWSISAGIHTPDGRLAAQYRPDPDPDQDAA